MRTLPVVLAIVASGAMAAAPPPMQPPMNDFDFAFYTCDGNGTFQISYDSETPKTATLTTNNKNKQYVLNRTRVADGVEFTSGAARFWTDGHKVIVEGAGESLQNCRRKSN